MPRSPTAPDTDVAQAAVRPTVPRRTGRTGPTRRARGAVRRLVATLTLALGASAATFAPALATPPPAAPAEVADEPAVVLIGTTGLRWDDVGTLSTPALWDLSRDASVGTVAARSVRSSACPADGWLAVSAGARAADLPGESYGECRTLLNPRSNGMVPGWAAYVESAEASGYSPTLGLLGQAVHEQGVTAAGFGPGAAIALSDRDGVVVGEHALVPADPEALSEAVAQALGTAGLVVVDAGSVRDTGRATVGRPDSFAVPEDEAEDVPAEPSPTGEEPAGPEVITEPTRQQQVQPIDRRVGAVLEAVRESDREVTVLLVSIADSGTRARMQLAAALGPGPGGDLYAESLLGSSSTRQAGMVQTTDVTPTVLSALGLAGTVRTGALVGAPLQAVAGPQDANGRLQELLGIDRHSAAVRSVTPTFFTALIVINLVLYVVVTLGLNGRVLAGLSDLAARMTPGRRPRARVESITRHPTAVLHALRVAGLAVASLPVASFLANLSPWWAATSPGWAVTGLIAAWVVGLTALAALPRWRHPLLGPVGVVAGITSLVLAIDVATGATLQISAPMGVQPVVAGRFYGFNNTAFAMFAAASILTAVAATDPFVRVGRRRQAAVFVAVIGLSVTYLVGMPGLGSDFGGPPALVPGFAVLALLAAGARLTWPRLVAILGGGALVVTSFALIDWLRPDEDRTHLGRFVDTVLDGGLADVVGRKLAQNLANLGGTWLTLLALGGIALVVLVLARPLRWAASASDGGPFSWLSAGTALTSLGVVAPMLRPGVVALAVTLGIGFAVNDSGIVIPAIGVAVAVPLLVAACASWLLQLRAHTAAGTTTVAAAPPEDT
ncbi:hypothetical protein [Actinotalea sp. K2]|uniref:hypothetical protein n=1 Tax=Actinotalea sp. K2 TaxID=2939438 RepID=UPI0020171986|nr:hypothetical protein [Actinotalea sp. K2]MCL3863244.1 hypothetical protein [Actinotalea sp. K2]